MSPDPAQMVRQLAYERGFALVGVAAAGPTGYEEHIRRWLGRGRHGEMGYLERNLEARLDPRKLVPGAKSVVCVADRYPGVSGQSCSDAVNNGSPSSRDAQAELKSTSPQTFRGRGFRGRVARYAWGQDYHKVMKKRLFTVADAMREQWPGHEFRCAVDTGPVLEREHAQRAGLGWVGKHTLLIHPRKPARKNHLSIGLKDSESAGLGSWLLLGEIVTTLEMTPDEAEMDHCGTCTRCIDACPTGCITPHELDARRCISYLTIEHRGLIEPGLQVLMGDWIAGCDVCQEVCPFNQGRAEGDESGGEAPGGQARGSFDLLEVLGWGVAERQKAFERSALKRIKLEMIKRNALIAAGNALRVEHDEALYRRIEELAVDADEVELVRETARQVLAGLGRAR